MGRAVIASCVVSSAHPLRGGDGLFGHCHKVLRVSRLRQPRAEDDWIARDGTAEVAAVMAAVGSVGAADEGFLEWHYDHKLFPEAELAIALDAAAHQRGVNYLKLRLVGADASFHGEGRTVEVLHGDMVGAFEAHVAHRHVGLEGTLPEVEVAALLVEERAGRRPYAAAE